MANFSFIHAADLHLDSPFRGLAAHGALRDKLQRATFDAFHRIVSLAISEKAAFVVLAGDLFDERDRSVRARLHLRDELVRLHEAGISSFIVHGNHDPLSGDSKALGLPPSVKVFTERWEEAGVERNGELLCRVQGISYPREKVTEDLSRHFKRQGPEFTVGLLHCNLGDPSHANYAPCTVDDLGARELDYWALGHVHTRAEHVLSPAGLAVYPGNPQGRHVNEAGPRGCVAVTVKDGRPATRFVPLDVVRWHRLDADVSEVRTLDALEAAVEEVIDQSCVGPDLVAHACRVMLTGRGPMHRELSPPQALKEMEERLRESLARRSPPVLLESLRQGTRPELNLGEILQAGGLPAAVLKEVNAARDNASVRESLLADDEWRKLDSALKKVGIEAASLAASRMLDRAAYRALELLAVEEEGG
ncbi:MAG: exonuclease SbcCD subunit D [Myxococcaceae bacterium]